jgi:plastocyanin
MASLKVALPRLSLFGMLMVSAVLMFNLTVSSAEELHKHHEVQISGFAFVPKTISVSPGDIVTWVNKDVVPHNVIVSGSNKIISPNLASGEKHSFVVENAMTYFCGFHPSMKGELTTP